MITFILILLLVAAVFGVLGAVLKVALILVLSFVLATSLMLWAGWWWFRNRMQAFQRDLELEARVGAPSTPGRCATRRATIRPSWAAAKASQRRRRLARRRQPAPSPVVWRRGPGSPALRSRLRILPVVGG